MSTARVLVVQPAPSDPPGRLGEWLVESGLDRDVIRPWHDPVPSTLSGYDGLVVLGGPMSVHDVSEHPWLVPLRRLLATAVSQRTSALAIGLGAQLLALSSGGSVAAAERPEVGPGLVSKRDAAWQDSLFSDVPLLPDVVQYHADSIAALPSRAVLLASGSGTANQAFRVARSAYGLQFHIEADIDMVREWVRSLPRLAEWARPAALDRNSLDPLERDTAETWRPVVDRFARLVDGSLEPTAERGPRLN